jgi:hypothetical protein
MRIVRTFVMAVAALGLLASAVAEADAQDRAASGASKSSKKSANASAARKSGPQGDAEASLAKARRALDDGKAETAQQLADVVLTSQSKDSRNTARALALRGEAYLRQGRSVEAAADLESALWVKGGLDGSEREAATSARAQALKQVGLTPPAAPAPLERAQALAPSMRPPAEPAKVETSQLPPPALVSNPPPPVVAVAPPAPVETTPPVAARSAGWNSAVTVAERAPMPAPRGEAALPTTAAGTLPSSARIASTRADEVKEPEAGQAASGMGGIGGFFSNLFGGASSDAPATTAAVATSAPARAASPATSSYQAQRLEPAPSTSRAPLTPVRALPARAVQQAETPMRAPPVRTSAVMPPAATLPRAPQQDNAGSAYRLQLAAVRTKAEAEELANRVREEEPAYLGQRTFEIVEDVYGNMGRFYRVRIGSFSEPTEALSICATLRDKRMDCMVLDR